MEFIICTENGVRFELENQNPKKKFYFTATEPVCHDMKKTYLFSTDDIEKRGWDKTDVLKSGENEIRITDEIRAGSVRPLERMLELAR